MNGHGPNDGHAQLVELKLFLSMLAGPGGRFLELRYRHRDGDRFSRGFCPSASIHWLARRVLWLGPRADVYVGCAPRSRRAGTRDAVDRAWALWADCDGPDSVAALEVFQPQPSVVVASGSGPNRHAYWTLERPVTADQVERANARLANALGADRACADAGRILRAPHTYSHKHDPPAPVVPLRLDVERRLALDEVVGLLPDPPGREVVRGRVVARYPRDRSGLETITPAVYVERLLGVRVPRDRKVRCPFHEDRTPSLHVYESADAGWACYSTKCVRPNGRPRGGGIYDLAAPLYGLQTRGEQFRILREELERLFGISRG